MNKERLYDIIKNIKETLSLLDKALIKMDVLEDEDLRELIKSSLKQSLKWYLCQGHYKKRARHQEADFCIQQESAFLNSIDNGDYYNISYIY